MSAEDVFREVTNEIDSAMEKAVRAFAMWFTENWKHTYDKEKWKLESSDPYPGPRWIAGYNQAVDEVVKSLDNFFSDMRNG